MFDFSTITEVRLSSGAHDSAADGMCVNEMIAWFAGEPHSDAPLCSCPVLARYALGLNDVMPDDVRDRLLKPVVPLMIGTRDLSRERKRGELLAMWAVNKIVPPVLRARGFSALADRCEMASTLGDARNAAASVASYAANAAASYAASAAASYAASAAASYAANAAANTAAYAVASASAAYVANAYAAYAANAAAAYAANTAAYAAAYAAASTDIWTIAVDGLRQAILVGRHDGIPSTIDPVERHAALRDLVAA